MNPSRHAFAAFLALLIGPMQAQTTQPARPITTTGAHVMEALTVTGSSIRRVDKERTLPITVLDVDDLDARAAPTAAERRRTFAH